MRRDVPPRTRRLDRSCLELFRKPCIQVRVDGTPPAFREHELGLAETHYANPIGLDEARNFSSAFDLSRLAERRL